MLEGDCQMPSAEAVTHTAVDIAKVFEDFGKTWKIGGSQKIPSADDVQAVLDRAKWEVEYQAVNSHLKDTTPQVEMRHLMFKQAASGRVEVFVKMGEIE